jgi:uncharacterized protein (TIGR03000 family)
MTRWLAVVAAVACLGLVGDADAHVFRHCHEGVPAPASADDWLAGWNWACGCWGQFGFMGFTPPVAAATVTGTPATSGPAAPPTPGPGPSPQVTRPPTPPAAPGKLHVLLLVDDANPNAGPANKAGAALLEKTLRGGVPEDRLGKVETLSGSALTPDRIRARIIALGVRPQDAVVGYYSGAMDYDEPTRAYTLNPTGGGRFPRADLREALLARRAALTVLLTDAPAYRVLPEMLPPHQLPAGPFNLERLVFQNRGIVDVHAAAAGEMAFPRGGEGGLFTLAVVDELRRIAPDGPGVAWPSLVDRIRATTDRLYVEYRRAVLSSDKVSAEDKRVYREQAHQTPTVLTPLDQVRPVAPPAGSKPAATSPRAAEIVVHVPAGAKVFVEERPTRQTGPDRHFETAELLPGRAYTYAIRAEQDRGGRTVSQTKRVTVRAGERATVRFEWAY